MTLYQKLYRLFVFDRVFQTRALLVIFLGALCVIASMVPKALRQEVAAQGGRQQKALRVKALEQELHLRRGAARQKVEHIPPGYPLAFEGIIRSENGSAILINGEIKVVGDQFMGCEIVSIGADSMSCKDMATGVLETFSLPEKQ